MTTSGERFGAALGALLLRSTRARLYDRLVADLPGVDAAAYPVLSGRARTGPQSATGLAVDLGLDRSVVSRHADRLEAAGQLRRSPDPADARASVLTLTTAGSRTVRTLRRRLVRELDAVLAGWPEDLARTFADGLEQLVAAL